MTVARSIAANALILVLASSTGSAAKADSSSELLTVKPLHGISFDLGSKRAAAYFRSVAGYCKLVLTYAEPLVLDIPPAATVTRFESDLLAGRTIRYTSIDNAIADFRCGVDAKSMTILLLKDVATTDN